MKVRKQVKQRAGAGRDVRLLVNKAIEESYRARDEARTHRHAAERFQHAMEDGLAQLRECRRALFEAQDQINDARACLGEHFVGLWPQLIESDFMSMDHLAQAGELRIAVDRLNPLLVGVERDLAGHRHVRVRLADKQMAYCVTKSALRDTDRAVLVKHVARDIARQLVYELKNN